jgi:hypothetical protein
MTFRIALGVFLLLIAALDVWAARDIAALEANPGAVWLVRLLGRSRVRPFLLVGAAFIALLGVVTIIFAISGITE